MRFASLGVLAARSRRRLRPDVLVGGGLELGREGQDGPDLRLDGSIGVERPRIDGGLDRLDELLGVSDSDLASLERRELVNAFKVPAHKPLDDGVRTLA